jgi:hypothetical protein
MVKEGMERTVEGKFGAPVRAKPVDDVAPKATEPVPEDWDVDADDLLSFATQASTQEDIVSRFYSKPATTARSIAPSSAESARTRAALEGVK